MSLLGWQRPGGTSPARSRFVATRSVTLCLGVACFALALVAVGAGDARAQSVATWVSSPGAGPVADFEPLEAVITHRALEKTAPDISRKLTELLGDRHYVDDPRPCVVGVDANCFQSVTERRMIWMRDYEPTFVRTPIGTIRIVRYLHPDVARLGYAEQIAKSAPETHPIRRLAQHASVEVLPIVHENGNLVTDGRTVFLTHRVLDENSRAGRPHLVAAGHRGRTQEEVLAVLASGLGRRSADFVVLPPLPMDRTGHIDLYLMALGPSVLLVPRVTEEALRLATSGDERIFASDIAAFLDHHARLLESVGFRIERLPMLAPFLTPADMADGRPDPDALFLTPTNSLLMRMPTRAHVLLPTLDTSDRPPAVGALQRRYEEEWRAFFRDRGWDPHFVDTTAVARLGGLVRCVTAIVPRSPGP